MSRENVGMKKRIIANRVITGIILIAAIFLAWVAFKLVTLPGLNLPKGEALDARYHIPAGHYHIGDRIPVEVEIRSVSGVHCQRPDLAASGLGKLELKQDAVTKIDWRRGGRLETVRFLVTGWEVGKYRLPALTLRYWNGKTVGVFKVTPIKLKIETVLPSGKSADELLKLDIKGIKGPLNLPPRYRILWWSLGVLFLLVLGVLFIQWLRNYWHKRKTADAVPDEHPNAAPDEPAHVIALRRLGSLEAGDWIARMALKPYYSELSEISREYMENRFQTKALEMTTEEFLTVVAKSDRLNREHQRVLSEFLQTADLVKFAKHIPPEETAREDLAAIRRLVVETAERPPENPPETVEKTTEHEVPA